MAYRIQFQAYGQHHDDVWLGCTKAKIQEVITEICPTAKIHSITKVDNPTRKNPNP